MFKAIVYRGFGDQGKFENLEAEGAAVEAVKELPEFESKTAMLMLVDKNILDQFRENKELFKNREKKLDAKSLKALMLGYEKIPFIEAGYKSLKKLKSSVRGFMRHVYDSSESNIYIIGIEKKVLDKLSKEIEKEQSKGGQREEMIMEYNLDPKDIYQSSGLGHLLPKKKVSKEMIDTINKKYIGNSPQIKFVKNMIVSAAQSETPVLILGDTGTGKSLIANLIHQISMRQNGKYRAINCSALPAQMLESELFGHMEGAFTGAIKDKKGLWETTTKGSLFLDELGDLALDHQVKILRAIQEKKIRRIGSEDEIDVNTRLIAATNRDLDMMMQEGTFREDLYYRLRDFTIQLPPLRQHKEDIPDLVYYFWNRITASGTPRISREVIKELKKYDWPGNGRDLESVLKNLYSIYKDEKIQPEYLQLVTQLRRGKTGVKKGRQNEIILHGVECLLHLKRTDEVMRAIKVALRPVIWHHDYNKDKVEHALGKVKNYIEEMEMLLLHPINFHAQNVFHMVRDLNGTIRDDLCNAKSGKDADRLWERHINKQYDETHEKIFSEVRWLEKLAQGGNNNG